MHAGGLMNRHMCMGMCMDMFPDMCMAAWSDMIRVPKSKAFISVCSSMCMCKCVDMCAGVA